MAQDARIPNVDCHTDLEAGKKAAAAEQSEMARGVSISRVRMQFRGLDSNSYTPQYVPIGPYHPSCSSAQIEKEKLRGVSFLKSLSDENTEGGLTRLVEKLEPRARECYADGVGQLTPEQFSSMLLLDGCYLLLLFVNYVTGACGNGAPTAAGCDDSAVVRDTVFLLENQIPLFVLQKIHEHITGGTSMSVLEDIAVSVQELLQAQLYISKKPRPAPPQSSHLLHLVHAYFRPTNLPTEMEDDTAFLTGRWCRATEYRRHAGVRFKRRVFVKGEKWTVLDVRLKRGTMWIPRLRVDSNTWTILRNLMALEEQIPQRPVTAYCIFLSQVAGTVEDVKLLVGAGIVEHFLATDEQVAQGFANLCMGVVLDVDDLDRNYLKPIWHRLQERYQSRVFGFMGWFCHYQHVGMAIAFLMAVIVLVCQVTQTFYAVTAGGSGQRPKQ